MGEDRRDNLTNTSIVRSLVTAASSCLDHSSSSDFDSLVSETRSSFRRRKSKIKKYKKSVFKKRLLLLRRANVDFVPSSSEITHLKHVGLGYAAESAIFEQNWSLEEIERYVCSLFPNVPLNLTGFSFARSDRQRKLIRISLSSTQVVDELRRRAGQGILYLIPLRDLPYESTRRHSEHPVLEETIITSNESATAREPRRITVTRPDIVEVLPSSTEMPSAASIRDDIKENIDTDYWDFLMDNMSDNNYHHYKDASQVNCDTGIDELEFPNLPPDASYTTISIRRENVVEELLNFYKSNDTVITDRLIVTFVNETGSDLGGLTKELFTIFFKEIEQTFFSGEDVLIPFMPLHRQRKEINIYRTIGKIMDHCTCITTAFPSRKYSRTFLMKLASQDNEITSEVLLTDFLLYVTSHERRLIKKALDNFDEVSSGENEQLVAFFSSYGLYELPKGSEFREQILVIAKETLMIKPSLLVDEIRLGLQRNNYNKFWSRLTVSNITILLNRQRPTPDKVVSILSTPLDLTNAQERVLYFLKTYIHSLNCDDLDKFLLFVTGSSDLPLTISVSFTNISGLNLRPCSHTCSSTIEISTCYENYQEFKRNFNIFLNNEYSFEYSLV